MFVVVAADAHPDPDEWVRDEAEAEARRSGLTLGAYLGREDYFGSDRPPDLCCHVFAAEQTDGAPS